MESDLKTLIKKTRKKITSDSIQEEVRHELIRRTAQYLFENGGTDHLTNWLTAEQRVNEQFK